MKFIVIFLAIVKIMCVENRVILRKFYPPKSYQQSDFITFHPIRVNQSTVTFKTIQTTPAPVRPMKEKINPEQKDTDNDYSYYELQKKKVKEKNTNTPCSIVVLSNIQNPNIQSLLRKYRYNANGILIPNSVRYFYKVPKENPTEPDLVPLNDKSFTALGGFVRYYKEVPPIPRLWLLVQ